MTSNDLKDLLDSEAARINSPGFISEDPVQFPRRFEDVRDIEIVSLLTSSIAWGNRRMICRDCDRMLSLMGHHPYAYMMDEGYEDLDDSGNIHRTFFNRHFKYYLRGLRRIYSSHGSLQEFGRHENIGAAELPSWKLVEGINRELAEATVMEPTPRWHRAVCLRIFRPRPSNESIWLFAGLCATTALSIWVCGI